MRVKIQKWGNSLAVRIPKTIALESKISQGSEVDLTLEKGRVVLNPVKPPRYSLEKLLAGVSTDNLHEEVDTGEAVGRESW
ncbi:MAG: AbrB/MazE/SpoVT family DNA-binding domain-containing protein [Acidobacteria bacterium]|nr:AbrB/MazE/SpoVT family DNA-binding domain-containing protein [Acidobacteriota bacterium]